MRCLLLLSFLFAACQPNGRWPGQQQENTLEGKGTDAANIGVVDVRISDVGSASPDASADALFFDSNIADVRVIDADAPDASLAAPDASAGTADVQGATCGNGEVESGENCDDGVTLDCVSTHDGGDGLCVAAGTCSDGFTISGDDCVLAEERFVIDVFVSNFCEMSTSPEEFTVPAGQTAYFTWRNRSVDYPIDVWKSYGGGFLDLPTGQNWEEGFAHCAGPNPSEQFADIDAGGCASFRFLIHCL